MCKRRKQREVSGVDQAPLRLVKSGPASPDDPPPSPPAAAALRPDDAEGAAPGVCEASSTEAIATWLSCSASAMVRRRGLPWDWAHDASQDVLERLPTLRATFSPQKILVRLRADLHRLAARLERAKAIQVQSKAERQVRRILKRHGRAARRVHVRVVRETKHASGLRLDIDFAERDALASWLRCVLSRDISRLARRERIRACDALPETLQARAHTARDPAPLLRDIEALLRQKPPSYLAVFRLRREGLGPQAVAERLGISPRTVHSINLRTNKLLRATFAVDTGDWGYSRDNAAA